MKNTLEKIANLSRSFLANLYSEIEKDPGLKRSLAEAGKALSNTPVKPIYRSLQFADYLISRSLKDYCPAPRVPSATDRFFERTFHIPQYYGGLRGRQGTPLASRLLPQLPVVREYRAIEHIEDEVVPGILRGLFGFEELRGTTKEAEETLRQLSETIFKAEPEWSEKEVEVEDVRLVETESVKVANLRKMIKCGFELAVILKGKHKGEVRHLRRVFECSVEFISEDGKWVASSFSFKPFS